MMDSIPPVSEQTKEPPGYVERGVWAVTRMIRNRFSLPSKWSSEEINFFRVLSEAMAYKIVDRDVIYEQFQLRVEPEERERVFLKIGVEKASSWDCIRNRIETLSQIKERRIRVGEAFGKENPEELIGPLQIALDIILQRG